MRTHHLVAQARSLRLLLSCIFAFASLVLAGVFLIHVVKGVPIGDMMRDPVSVAELSFYTGLVSQLGVLLWASAATACLFAAIALGKNKAERQRRNFFIGFAVLTLALGLDDVFLIHEVVLPHFGLSEVAVYAFYAVLVTYLFANFYRTIFATDFLLLGLAFGFFGLSLILDVSAFPNLDPHLFEESAKLLGILCWLGYFFRTSVAAVTQTAAGAAMAADVAPRGGDLGRYAPQQPHRD